MAKASFDEPNPIPNISSWHDRPNLKTIERKNLENVLEADDENSIQIYLRLRPNSKNEQTEEYFKIIDSKTIEVTAPPDSVVSKSYRSGSVQDSSFVFSQIFEPCTSQKILFNSCVLNAVHKFINSKSSLLFSYGTTNAGKTYTIHGTKHEPGIIPRVLSILFKSIKNKQCDESKGLQFRPHLGNSVKELDEAEIKEQILIKERILNCSNETSGTDLFQSAVTHMTDCSYANTSTAPSEFSQMEEFIDDEIISLENEGNVIYSVWVSFLEIYNEHVYDLLVPPSSEKRATLEIKQDEGKHWFVKGLKHVHVNSGIEAYKVLLVGKNNLQVASTNLNRSSSRSHCVFSIKLIKREDVENPETATLSCFSICDLAGAERLEKTGNTGNRMKETQNINTSLHILGRCFKTMLENQSRPHNKKLIVPYRESKLTQLFYRQLSGKFNEDVIMIVNINTSPKLFEETAHVLKASAIAKQIINKMPILKHKPTKRKSLFSTLVYENKNRDTIPWETIEESDEARPDVIDLDQLIAQHEQEKQRIRDECEEFRLRSVDTLDNMIQEMITQHNQQLEETRDLHMKERIRRENLYRECIAGLKAEIAALTGEQSGSQSSGYNSDINVNLQASETLESQLQEAKKEEMVLKSEISLLKTQNQKLVEKIRALEKELDKIAFLEKDLRSSQQSCERLKKLLDEAKKDMLDNDKEKEDILLELGNAQSKVNELIDESEDLNKTIVIKNRKIEALENEVDSMTSDMNDLQQKIDAKNETIELLHNEVDQLKQKIEHIVVDHDRTLNNIEKERDAEKAKNASLENKIEDLTLNFSKLQTTDSGCEVQSLKLQVEELKKANEEKDVQHAKVLDDVVTKYENKLKEMKELFERSGNREKAKKTTKKELLPEYDFESKENEPVFEAKSEPKRRIRTRNQVKTGVGKSMNVRRSKSSDSRVLLGVQYPDNYSVNRTPSSKSVSSDVEKPLTKSCRKKLYNYHDFVDEDTKPVKFNPVILSSPKSELKTMKRRLRNQTTK